MARPRPLSVSRLRAGLDPASLSYEDSRSIAREKRYSPPQPRALQALELALSIPGSEYHVYLAGNEGLGRTYFIRRFLAPVAAAAPTPPDLLYVADFADLDRPLLLTLPAGRGKAFKAALAKAVAAMQTRIPAILDLEDFTVRREELARDSRARKDSLYQAMEQAAEERGFALSVEEEGSLTISPVVDGQTLSPAEFERMEPVGQKKLKAQRDDIMADVGLILRQSQSEDREFKERELDLQREFATAVVEELLAPLRAEFGAEPKAVAYLAALAADVLDSLDLFMPRSEPNSAAPQPAHEQGHVEDEFYRYEVNLVVDHSATHGAPVVVEDHPTWFNVMGCIERESELGALYTDFTLIKAGAIHRANGGFLILRVDDLSGTTAWEALLRALRCGCARIEDPAESAEQVRTRTIEPAALPLSLKVVLIGSDETWEALLYHDARFRKLFKIKAQLQDHVPRNAKSIKGFLQDIGRIVREAGLPPFDREALAGLVDYSSRLAADQKKLSLRYPQVRELMIEAAAMARSSRKAEPGAGEHDPVVSGEVLRKAMEARDFRSNLYEEEFMADYDREIIKVPTSGSAVGRVNGLSVTYFGDYVFGLPHQIAATVGVGREGIIDLEREAELGGPIHTKAMMILKSYLLALFAHDKPIILSGSLCFEQSYAEVEGDSASGAELAALLSALAEVPNDLSLAFTGAVNQSGTIMAVGDPTRKVEGFFEVCRRRGLSGRQGVIIPADNVDNLMLKHEVLEAVEAGRFHIWPVAHIEEAMELLTGMPAGRRAADGSFPQGTLFHLVDERLARLAEAALKYGLR